MNVLGSVYLTQALLPAMMERGDGRIVFISSLAGQVAGQYHCQSTIIDMPWWLFSPLSHTAWSLWLYCLFCFKVCSQRVG